MYFSMKMVIDQEKSDYCSIDVSFIISYIIMLMHIIHTGDSRTGILSKIQFGRIVDGNLVYDEGKDDHFVFEGMSIAK